MSLLVLDSVAKSFGGVQAVQGCSFEVKEGSITALIGPNGAGKTTVFNIISGLYSPDAGEIRFGGVTIAGHAPHEIFNRGIARTFQLLRIFPKLSAEENLMFAQPARAEGMFDRIFRPHLVREEEARRRARARELLAMIGLLEKADVMAGELSYGQQKLLDIARCIASGAKLLMLDEPVAGVNPTIRKKIKAILLDLKKNGATILIVEHDMNFIMTLADEIVVLDHGIEIAVGTPVKIKKNKKVINAYLGEGT